jgi:antitoxin component YwqK of YwqJK toxin-antitoxin module
MSIKHGGLASILALGISLPGFAQSNKADVPVTKPKTQSADKPVGISILEFDDSEELLFTVPAPATTTGRNTKSAEQRGIPANSIPARLSSYSRPATPDQEGAELIRQRFPNGAVQIERWVKEDGKGNIVNHGSFTEFAANGSIITSGNYHLGQREASWTKQITAEEAKKLVPALGKGFTAPFTSQAEFRSGKLHGDWILTDSKGNIVFTWGMEAGQRHGSSTFYGPKGEVTQSITYDKNVAHGPAKLASESGAAAEPQELVRGMILRRVDKWYPAAAGSKAAPCFSRKSGSSLPQI